MTLYAVLYHNVAVRECMKRKIIVFSPNINILGGNSKVMFIDDELHDDYELYSCACTRSMTKM